MIVRRGTWVYADNQIMPVDIIGLRYDFWAELSRADSEEPGVGAVDEPEPLGADGMLYYVRFRHAGETTVRTWPDSSGYQAIDAAMHAAQTRVPTPIDWFDPDAHRR